MLWPLSMLKGEGIVSTCLCVPRSGRGGRSGGEGRGRGPGEGNRSAVVVTFLNVLVIQILGIGMGGVIEIFTVLVAAMVPPAVICMPIIVIELRIPTSN